jgi:hypothetical protein
MIRSLRTARATLRQRRTDNRASRSAARAARAITTGQPIAVATYLTGRGLNADLVNRFAGAVSCKVGAADATGSKRKRLSPKGGRMATFTVKLYAPHRIATVLITYRPKNPTAAAAFMALAA